MAERSSLLRLLVVEPLAYILLLAAGLQGLLGQVNSEMNGVNYMTFVFPGIVGLQLLRTFTHSIYRLTIERRWGLQALKIAAGTTPLAYVLGMATLPVLLFVIQVLVSVPVALALGASMTAGGVVQLLIASIPAALFWTGLAISLTFVIRSYSQRDFLLALLLLPLSFAAPVFYSLDRAPAYLQWIAKFNPLAYQVQSFREAFAGNLVSISLAISLMGSFLLLGVSMILLTRSELLASER